MHQYCADWRGSFKMHHLRKVVGSNTSHQTLQREAGDRLKSCPVLSSLSSKPTQPLLQAQQELAKRKNLTWTLLSFSSLYLLQHHAARKSPVGTNAHIWTWAEPSELIGLKSCPPPPGKGFPGRRACGSCHPGVRDIKRGCQHACQKEPSEKTK